MIKVKVLNKQLDGGDWLVDEVNLDCETVEYISQGAEENTAMVFIGTISIKVLCENPESLAAEVSAERGRECEYREWEAPEVPEIHPDDPGPADPEAEGVGPLEIPDMELGTEPN